MGKKLSAITRAALVLLLVVIQLGVISSADAIVATPEPINQPLPDHLRAPLARLLQEIGVKDAERVLTNTKIGEIGGGEPEVVILRLEDTSTCFKDLCLTVVGHIGKGVVHVGVIVLAGKMVTVGDVLMDLFGNPGHPPIYILRTTDLETDPSVISLWRTPRGWIVAPAFK